MCGVRREERLDLATDCFVTAVAEARKASRSVAGYSKRLK
jgi:hypothetical protein